MEHNGYAVHTVKVRYIQDVRHTNSNDDFSHWTHETREEVIRFVAPAQNFRLTHLGVLLVDNWLNERFRHNQKEVEPGKKHVVLERSEESINGAIIRYSDEYRAQL